MEDNIKKYTLEKDSIVEVHKIFGDEYYIAIVEMHGVYPESGKIAHNVNRDEYMYVIDGEMTLTVNKEEIQMKKGDHYLVKNGDYYEITGNGRSLVFVHDTPGGISEIVEKTV